MSHKRLKNVQHVRPIIYGSYSQPLKPDEPRNDPSHTHKWAVFVKGHNGEDLSSFIKKISFRLHESFQNPERIIEEPPYIVSETGWGEFEINTKIFFRDPQEKPIQFFFQLHLYPKEVNPGQDMNATDKKALESGKAMISEYYDEIVFYEPTEEMVELFEKNPPIETPLNPAPKIENFNGFATTFDDSLERRELKKLDNALAVVHKQCDEARSKVKSLNLEFQELRKDKTL